MKKDKIDIKIKKIRTPYLSMSAKNEDEIKNGRIEFDMYTEHKETSDTSYFGKVAMTLAIVDASDQLVSLIITEGEFELLGVKQEKIEQYLRVNAAAMLYPYLREKLSSLTAMAGFSPYYLPSKNFVTEYEDYKEKESLKTADEQL